MFLTCELVDPCLYPELKTDKTKATHSSPELKMSSNNNVRFRELGHQGNFGQKSFLPEFLSSVLMTLVIPLKRDSLCNSTIFLYPLCFWLSHNKLIRVLNFEEQKDKCLATTSIQINQTKSAKYSKVIHMYLGNLTLCILVKNFFTCASLVLANMFSSNSENQ